MKKKEKKKERSRAILFPTISLKALILVSTI